MEHIHLIKEILSKSNSDYKLNDTPGDDMITGVIALSTREVIDFELDKEEEEATFEIYELLADNLANFIQYLTVEKLNEYKELLATEITKAAYEQDDYQPSRDNIKELYDDLELKKIYVANDAFVLWYKSANIYEEEDLTMQINMPGYEIDDISCC